MFKFALLIKSIPKYQLPTLGRTPQYFLQNLARYAVASTNSYGN